MTPMEIDGAGNGGQKRHQRRRKNVTNGEKDEEASGPEMAPMMKDGVDDADEE